MDSDSDDSSSSTDSSSDSTTSIPAASAGILMLSLPDSLDDDGANHDDDNKSSADQDVFETPPEYALVGTSQEKTPLLDLDQIGDDRDYEGVGVIGDGSGVIVAVGGCGEEGVGAVDLGRDTDFVVTEAESVEFKVSKRDWSLEGGSAESPPPSKKLRVSEDDSGKSDEELETEPLSLSNLGSNSDQTLEIAGDDAKSVEESSGKKKDENSGSESENGTEEIQSVTEESGSPSGMEYLFEEDGEIDSRDSQVLRVLPLSFCPPAESSRMQAEEGDEWSRLLEMVKLVNDITCKEDNEVDNCSLLEIAKRRGVTFPRL